MTLSTALQFFASGAPPLIGDAEIRAFVAAVKTNETEGSTTQKDPERL